MSKCFCNFDFDLKDIVPVVQGGMQWVGYAELASAVSNAGGLGIVSYDMSSVSLIRLARSDEFLLRTVDQSDPTNT